MRFDTIVSDFLYFAVYQVWSTSEKHITNTNSSKFEYIRGKTKMYFGGLRRDNIIGIFRGKA